MVLFDTNVILRYILRDNLAMTEKIKRQLSIEIGYVPIEVIAEVVYVLSKVYKVERNIISQIITDITNTDKIRIIDTNVVQHALEVFASSSLDFVDCLLVGYAKEKQYFVFTFDKKLQKYL